MSMRNTDTGLVGVVRSFEDGKVVAVTVTAIVLAGRAAQTATMVAAERLWKMTTSEMTLSKASK